MKKRLAITVMLLWFVCLMTFSGMFAPIGNPGGGGGGGSNHNLLSSTHSDSTAAGGVRGDILRFVTTWERLGLGTNGQCLISNGTDALWGACSAGGAPSGATYWTGSADGTLSAENNLGALATALVINTAGVPSAYAGGTCTNQFIRVLSAVGGLTCNTVTSAFVDSSIALTGSSNSWGDGVKQTFNPNGTNAGINVGAQAGDPSSLADGDIWYNSSTLKLRCRENGASQNCIGGTSAPTDATYITQTANGTLTNEQALSSLASGCLSVTTGTGVLASSGTSCGSGNLALVVVNAGNNPYTTLTGDKVIICDTTAGSRTINLITANANTGVYYKIKNVGTSSCTIDAAGTETIDGGLTAVLTNQYEAIDLVAESTNKWHIF